MTDQQDDGAKRVDSPTVTAARQALQMKTAAAASASPAFRRGRVGDERAAAARSAARSKPALRK